MVTVRVTETYDMKTSTGKLGIVGIHTPSMSLVNKLYPGLVKNYKFVRFKKCNVIGACASVLPADPLQVGVTSGTVAPEDMFNPILYKAVSNDSFDSLVSRIYDSVNTTDVLDRTGSVNSQDLNITADNAFKTYYALLSENGVWRKSMPQTGFAIKNLYPICHTLLSSYGNVKKPANILVDDATETSQATVPANLADVPFIAPDMSGVSAAVITMNAYTFRGKSVKMPRFPLHYKDERYDIIDTAPPAPPKTFVACMIIPPAKLHEFYYRMRVTWTVSFEELVSTLNYAKLAFGYSTVGNEAHGTNYTYPSAKSELSNSTDSVDTDNVELNKIMES